MDTGSDTTSDVIGVHNGADARGQHDNNNRAHVQQVQEEKQPSERVHSEPGHRRLDCVFLHDDHGDSVRGVRGVGSRPRGLQTVDVPADRHSRQHNVYNDSYELR